MMKSLARSSKRLITREMALGLTIALIVGASAFVYGLRWIEWSMTFHPAPIAEFDNLTSPPGAEDVLLITGDGVRLHGWFFSSRSKPDSGTILYFHGNG